MAIAGSPRCLGDDDRIAFGWAESRFQSDALAKLYYPFSTGLEILLVCRLGGNAWETKVLAKLVNGAGFVLFEVINNGLHEVAAKKIWLLQVTIGYRRLPVTLT
jgi:hypothetical protein